MAAVTITEDVLNLGTNTYHKDDTIAVDETTRTLVIDNGWGLDPHTGEQGERKPGAARRINLAAVTQSSQ